MYMVVRKYQMKPGASAQEIVKRVEEGFVPIISQTAGFVGYYIVNTGNNSIASVTVFQDQVGADESTRRASSWVSENLISLLQIPAQITEGEVLFSQTS